MDEVDDEIMNGIVPDDFFETRKQKLLSPDQTYNTKIFIMGNTSASELKRNQDLINIDIVGKFLEYLEDDLRMCEKLDECQKMETILKI